MLNINLVQNIYEIFSLLKTIHNDLYYQSCPFLENLIKITLLKI